MLSFISITLALIFGIAWGLYLEFDILVIALIFLLWILLALILTSYHFYFLTIKRALILFIIFAFGIFYCRYRINKFDSKYPEGDFQGMLTIISHVEETKYYDKYYAKNGQKDKFLIYFKKSLNTNKFQIGSKVLIDGKFELANVARNTGGFNYRRYLNANGIYGIIKISNYQVESLETRNPIYYLQNKIRESFLLLLPDDVSSILNGIVIGETQDIPEDIKDDFRSSGIAHLLAVSGTHIAFVIAMSKFVFDRLVGKGYASYFIIICILFFVFLSGASPSVIRAGLMAILAIVANLLERKSNSVNNIFFAAFVLLIMNPVTLMNTGFILSFSGTIGIILLNKVIVKKLRKFISQKTLVDTIGITLSAQMILLPIMAYFFHTISIVSLFTNLFIVPVWGVVMFLTFMILIFSLFSKALASIPAVLVTYILKIIVAIAKFFSYFPFFNITVIRPRIFFIVIYYVFLYVFLSRHHYIQKYQKKILIVLVALVLMVQVSYLIPKNYIEISAIDVGQGDSFLISTSHHQKILIDGGGSKDADYDVGESVLVPYLLNHQITQIDLVIISHAHADHINGIFSVLEKLKVGTVMIGPQKSGDENIEKLYRICQEKNIRVLTVYQGESFCIDDITFDVLYPAQDMIAENLNHYSLVLKMCYATRSMLFTGDLEKEGEEQIVTNFHSDFLDVDILKVGHHGAKTSSTEEFLKRVKPEISIISVSAKNTYRSS